MISKISITCCFFLMDCGYYITLCATEKSITRISQLFSKSVTLKICADLATKRGTRKRNFPLNIEVAAATARVAPVTNQNKTLSGTYTAAGRVSPSKIMGPIARYPRRKKKRATLVSQRSTLIEFNLVAARTNARNCLIDDGRESRPSKSSRRRESAVEMFRCSAAYCASRERRESSRFAGFGMLGPPDGDIVH